MVCIKAADIQLHLTFHYMQRLGEDGPSFFEISCSFPQGSCLFQNVPHRIHIASLLARTPLLSRFTFFSSHELLLNSNKGCETVEMRRMLHTTVQTILANGITLKREA